MVDALNPRFVTVLVEEHPAIPEGCCLRFKSAGEKRMVRRVRYEAPDGTRTEDWLVEGADRSDRPVSASAVPVEDSGAGISVLVYGAEHGLRLRPAAGGIEVPEAYLLLAGDAIVE